MASIGGKVFGILKKKGANLTRPDRGTAKRPHQKHARPRRVGAGRWRFRCWKFRGFLSDRTVLAKLLCYRKPKPNLEQRQGFWEIRKRYKPSTRNW